MVGEERGGEGREGQGRGGEGRGVGYIAVEGRRGRNGPLLFGLSLRPCGAILYRLRDIATYWYKIAKFIASTGGDSVGIS